MGPVVSRDIYSIDITVKKVIIVAVFFAIICFAIFFSFLRVFRGKADQPESFNHLA